MSIDRLLAEVTAGLTRLKPHDAAEAVRAGGILVDTRPEYQRRADGDIPGAVTPGLVRPRLASYDLR